MALGTFTRGDMMLAYTNSSGDKALLLRKAITGFADFGGRSRRTEVIYYWIATALAGVVLNFVLIAVAPIETSLLAGNAFELISIVPTFALFVRRLHDQDKSGWWGLLLLASFLLSIPKLLTDFRSDITEMLAYKTTPTDIAATICAAAVLVLCLWPGTDGENRFGFDPRLDDAEVS